MKKYLLTALIACISYLASAQRTQHALGFHIGGSTIDLEYQYHMSEKNFLDFTVGVFNLDDGFLAQGIYNWNIQQWSDWTPDFATWKLWGGVGAGVGFVDHKHHDNSNHFFDDYFCGDHFHSHIHICCDIVLCKHEQYEYVCYNKYNYKYYSDDYHFCDGNFRQCGDNCGDRGEQLSSTDNSKL